MPTNMIDMTIFKSLKYSCFQICNVTTPKSLSLIESALAQS